MNYYKSIYHRLIACGIILSSIGCSKDDSSNTPPPDKPMQIEDFRGEIAWIKTFGGSNEDNALSIVETTDGGYAVAGYTQSIDGDLEGKTAADTDYWLLKLDKDGTLVWSKTYGGSNDDRAEKAIQTTDGGFVLIGFSRSNDMDVSENAGLQDYWIIKTSATGDKEWERSFGFAGIDQAFSVIQTNDGGYFITGFLDVSASENQGNDDKEDATTGKKTIAKHGVGEFWGIKLDASGNREWRRYFGGTNNDRSYDVVQTKDNGFLMIGSTESVDFDITNNNGMYDFWAIKINSKGTKLWQKAYGGTEIDIGYAIAASADGNYVVIGDSRSNDGNITASKGNADLWMIKIDDAAGTLIWQKSLGGSAFDSGRGIHKMKNGGFIITGNSRSNDLDVSKNNGQSDLWNLIIDTDGAVKWSTTNGGSGAEFGQGCIETKDGAVVVVGSSESSDFDIPINKGSKDILVVKYLQ